MRIIRLGNKLEDAEKEHTMECGYCGTVFAWWRQDVRSDFRDGDYVVCPNPRCMHFLTPASQNIKE